ncbi:DUF1501 domain-containing protein [Lentisphaera profundi]|uniref:DUF1501 domain-containing protein n=1 Tax=Lentisphaera profundi TaxID=1658616 RepID=A0ABY7VSE7_9BACT|nr:DUF1501 domain-containing protein [Lentisphaera profundi]WDE96664.1 DUF1501 domain-containing protein [Lentisphaera profundi]
MNNNFSNPFDRRQFFKQSGAGLGGLALSSLMSPDLIAKDIQSQLPHFAPKAKRVIFLFMSGGPSQQDMFDHKPLLREFHGKELFKTKQKDGSWSKEGFIKKEQRLTGMTSGQKGFPIAGHKWDFKQHGKSGAWISSLMPHTAKIADDLCFIKSMHTDAINHDPGMTFFQTGSQIPGRPSIGSWLSYGLGSMNKNLPEFTVLMSNGTGRPGGQPIYTKLWGNGFLPSVHQGVQFRSGKDPVLYLNNPKGENPKSRRRMLDGLKELNQEAYNEHFDPETQTRINQYEMAYRMQTSVPDALDISKESEATFEMYGPNSKTPGTFAANCILARRQAEKGVRFIQLYHRGWDQHGGIPKALPKQCDDVDQASAALVTDLKQRGMLDDTLVVWGGEFGRTAYCQGKLTEKEYGRDHHPRAFTYWMAGGGVKPGMTHGETDEFSYNIVKDGVHVHDFHATMLHLLGVDHERLTYKYQGRRFRLTDVHGHVVKNILA